MRLQVLCKCYANAKHQDVIHHILSPHWFWIGLFHFGADLSTGDTPSVGMETVYRDDIKCLDTVQLGITLAIENPLTKRRGLSQIAHQSLQDAPKSRQIPIFSNHWARQAAGSESMGFMAMTYGISRGISIWDLYGIYIIRWDYDIDWNYEISVLHGFLCISMYFWDNLRYTLIQPSPHFCRGNHTWPTMAASFWPHCRRDEHGSFLLERGIFLDIPHGKMEVINVYIKL